MAQITDIIVVQIASLFFGLISDKNSHDASIWNYGILLFTIFYRDNVPTRDKRPGHSRGYARYESDIKQEQKR